MGEEGQGKERRNRREGQDGRQRGGGEAELKGR